MNKSILVSSLLFISGQVQAVGGVWDMYDPSGTLIAVDATMTGSFDQQASTWHISSTTPFYGLLWTAYDGVLYGEGTHTVNVNGDGADAWGDGTGDVTFTVGKGQLGGAINLNFGTTVGNDIINVWDVGADGSLQYAYVPGMIDGPFPGFMPSFSFDAGAVIPAAVPVPAAVWLFCSGLFGLAAVVHRRKAV